MQYWLGTNPIDIVLIEATVAFIVLVTILLLKYSKDTSLRLWTLGWSIYTTSSFVGAILISEIVNLGLAIVLVGCVVGTTMILDGSRGVIWNAQKSRRYVIVTAIAALWGILSLFMGLTLSQAFTPIQIYLGCVCIISAKQPIEVDFKAGLAAYGTAVGFVLLAFSSFVFPISNFYPILNLYALLQATALITIGTGLLSLLIRITTNRLESLHAIGKLTAGILQHDIRNYLHIASNAVNLAGQESEDGEQWRKIASESLEDASEFLEEMRKASIELTSFKARLVLVDIEEIIQRVRRNVIREYDLDDNQIVVSVPPKTMALSNTIVRELLWNILDNAFKHGGSNMSVELVLSDDERELVLSDDAGGMSEQAKQFIKTEAPLERALSHDAGLGLILIRGLAPLCGIGIDVEDYVEQEVILGTRYVLSFKMSREVL